MDNYYQIIETGLLINEHKHRLCSGYLYLFKGSFSSYLEPRTDYELPMIWCLKNEIELKSIYEIRGV